MDGYPSKFLSYITRLSRWIRGDWQIIKWLKSDKLNFLSKYKIFDNLRRSLFEISCVISAVFFTIISKIYNLKLWIPLSIISAIIILPSILEVLNNIVFKQEGEQKQQTFTPKIDGNLGAIYRGIISFTVFPFKAWISFTAILKTLYRLFVSKRHMLEWMTSEEAEKNSKDDIFSYFKEMKVNSIFGIVTLMFFLKNGDVFGSLIGLIWIISPLIMNYISKDIIEKEAKNKLNKEEIKYIQEVGKRTFEYFLDNITEENNYLIPDNYQEDRKNLYVDRTSSTNIGLSLLAIISGVDLGYINLDKANEFLKNTLQTIWNLKKWNGHLYNWYNISNLEPLIPRYISTVDSGNFVGYMYVVKSFLEKQENKELDSLVQMVDEMISNTDFTKLYSKEHRLFSIGFNIEERKINRFIL